MRLLKILKPKKPDVGHLAEVLANFEGLENMKLVKFQISKKRIIISPALWDGADKKFKQNWSRNAMLFFTFRAKGKVDPQTVEIQIFDDSQKHLANYSETSGLTLL